MTYQDDPTEEERGRAKELMEKVEGVIDPGDERLTVDEVTLLLFVYAKMDWGTARELVSISRGIIEGDVIGGYPGER